MWSGLRLRILLLLGAFLLLAFAPLYFAIATFADVSLQRLQAQSADHLLRVEVEALHGLTDKIFNISEENLKTRLRKVIDVGDISALALRENSQSWLFHDGEKVALEILDSESRKPRKGAKPKQVEQFNRRFLSYSIKGKAHEVFAVVELETEPPQYSALASLLVLYMAVGGAALLFVAYLALTHWIVRPVLNLEGAAERVERGGIMSHGLKNAPSEIRNLSKSLVTMTQQLRSEEEALRKKIAELEAKKVELASAQNSLIRSERLASVGHLAAGLAHEVGNPLSAILGILELLADGDLRADEERDFILRMKKETERIHQVMHELLTFARGDHATAPQQLSTSKDNDIHSNANQVLEGVLKLLKPQQRFKEISLETNLQTELPRVPIRSEELEQVLLNLLLNAGDACEGKGVISISTYQNGPEIRIDVRDNGPGVAPAYQETLFEPFVTSKEVGQGTGLGLSVSQGLLSSHGGVLELINDGEKGAFFRISFTKTS